VTDRRWERDPEVLWRATPFAVVVLPQASDHPLVLAGTSAELWDLLDEPRTVAELADELAQRYEAEQGVIAVDLSASLAALEGRRAVRSVV
jgi:hypothetical protein